MDYLSHYNCFIAEKPEDAPFYERIGFLDIEATGLKGNWDFILCFCIKQLDGDVLGRHLTTREILNYKFDRDITEELVRDIGRFHRIIVYYGKDYRYDVPFIRTRAERWGIEFPAYRDLWITDVYDIAKAKLSLHRTRLENVCNLLGIEAKGHRLDPDIWQKAQAGHTESLAWIFEHCREDVISLEAAWKRLQKYVPMRSHRSL
jgi:uncharacterized protein YprB with RNaseH-like and TPR domain